MRVRRRALLRLPLVLAGFPPTSVHAEEHTPTPEFLVVVNDVNPLTSAPRDRLTRIFLKQTTKWESGEAIRPVDLDPGSPVRKRFSEKVLKRSVEAVRNYWQQRIFSGRGLPPPELASDAAVVRYVAQHPGGIGYVAGNTKLEGVRVVTVK